jgi:putative protein kinase ArgK-like GTPase of G3E family
MFERPHKRITKSLAFSGCDSHHWLQKAINSSSTSPRTGANPKVTTYENMRRRGVPTIFTKIEHQFDHFHNEVVIQEGTLNVMPEEFDCRVPRNDDIRCPVEASEVD